MHLDDISFASHWEVQYVVFLRAVSDHLSKHGVTDNALKCELGKPSRTFLWHIIPSVCVALLPNKFSATRTTQNPIHLDEYGRLSAWLSSIDVLALIAQEQLPPLKNFCVGLKVSLRFASFSNAFISTDDAITIIELLTHPDPSASINPISDGSDTAV